MKDVFRLRKFIYSDVVYLNNYDGDTIDFRIKKGFDAGFGITVYAEKEIRVRLMGVDTFELRDKDLDNKAKAREAKDLVREKLLEAEKSKNKIIIVTYKDKTGSFGRYLAWVYVGEIGDESCVNNMLKTAGLTTGRYEKNAPDPESIIKNKT